jgi:ADP-ribose pyrophosphatase YjhB (NUDIX family)
MPTQDRAAARALLVTPEREVLLMQVEARPAFLVWITPGGGLHHGESARDAAVREAFEETGRRIEALVPVWTRDHTFELEQQRIRQRETYFLVHTPRFEPVPRGFEHGEERVFRGFRWWSIDAIRASDEHFAPRRLGLLLDELLARGARGDPIDVGI